ncbi:ArsR family transcriptional regulator [Anaerosolibacter carboniphilus]|uniref:ArsR family transcriptional regulator n=1 Tax=Anaerosolibacter carboniphilus TaxID=1417629 RepID=A0A841KVR5_9FIRM|nr:metalloregulator ArsR/SmtB family transcription factor [Anaerosolibacter carboniphilus]MBB6216318.1 ArsR family transcriptional regulator [Anaerosolibacter carboniphilus]
MKEEIEIFKALSDENRLKILEMLSCGELCACDIQDGLNLTQPTISHHMKVLQKVGLINADKRGKWAFYSIKQDQVDRICGFIKKITTPSNDCICNAFSCNCESSGCIEE